MDRSTFGFWLLVSVLLGASLFYGTEVASLRAVHKPSDTALASGDVVSATQVLDGDTLVVAKEGAGQATVRLLGIKAFEAKLAKDETTPYGRAAEEALKNQYCRNPPGLTWRKSRSAADRDSDKGPTVTNQCHAT